MINSNVAIIMPLHNRSFLTDSEEISLRHLNYYLSDYDKYFIASRNLKFNKNDTPVVRFDNKYFGSFEAHNRLCLSKDLYNYFSNYEYIFMYHLDCLVFDDNLSKWTETDYDYIAPPWIKGPDTPWLINEGVGNGGFSLRKVEAFQKLLSSNVTWINFHTKISKFVHSETVDDFFRNGLPILKHFTPSANNIQSHLDHFFKNGGHEDRFIWMFGKKYHPEFNIASIDEALEFAFEANPKICYEKNNFKLPFGCHAWEKYNKEFWEPFLINEFH